MKSVRFDRILRQVLIVPLLALILAAAALYYQMHLANGTVAQVQGADERIRQTNNILKLILDEETGLRAYQLTRDPVFLQPYQAASAQLPAALQRRLEMTTDAGRHTAVQELASAYESWHSGFAEPILATLKSGGSADDAELNLQGKRQMDAIRVRIDDINQLSQQRRDEYTATWHRQTRTVILAIAVTAILLGLVIGLYIRRLLQQVSSAFRQSNNALRIRAEQAFRSEQRLRTTLQSIGDAVITCSIEGRIDSMNAVAEQLCGFTATHALGKPFDSIFHLLDSDTREPVPDTTAAVTAAGRTIISPNARILVNRTGQELLIEGSGSPLRDKNATILGIVLVLRDITMARKSQQALIASEKLAVAGRLAATIAHEIHNPLDSISNLLFLMDGESTPEETKQFLELARMETARVTQITRSMLSLHRESRAPIPLDIKELLESILLLMDRRFHLLNVELHPQIPENLIIHGFPAELRQVFTNLLTNAAEACTVEHLDDADPTAAPRIEVTAEPRPATPDRPEGVLVRIHDNGPGIPPSVLANLFQPFFTTKGERGTGLGLWVSRGIVTRHAGTLDLLSSTAPENHGTTAEVFLALHPTPQSPATP